MAPPAGGALRWTPATARFLGILFVLLLGLQLALYRESFAVKPSNDDFVALDQVHRGETEGLRSFFVSSNFDDFRPLQNATCWIFGRFSGGHLLGSLRLLHFLSFTFYGGVAFLWIRALRFGRIGAVAAACVVFLHPTMAGPLAGLDNYARFVVSAWVWLGGWIAYERGGRLLLKVPLVSLCFALGLGYMEYAIALIPLAILAIAWRGAERRFRDTATLSLALAAIFITYFLIRGSGTAAAIPGTGFLSLDPLVWIKNAATIFVASLFFGNTMPVMLDASPARVAWLASNVTLATLAIGYGLWACWRRILPRAGAESRSTSPAGGNQPPGPGFPVAAFAVAFFPIILMKHISEIYLTGVTLGLALLIGLSAHGWTTVSRPLRYAALFLFAVQLCLAAQAVRGKVAGINEAGERADAMMRQLLNQIPDDSTARTIAMVFVESAAVGGKGYSVFALPDDQLVPTGYGTFAIKWFRPDLDIRLDPKIVADPSDVDDESYDLVLLWEPSTGRFRRLASPAAVP